MKIRSFEGLRGILSLLVCFGHYGINKLTNRFGVNIRYELAVDVFFALSGYVLCHTNYFGKKSLPDFIAGRFARLYPLHLLTLLCMLLLYVLSGRVLNKPEVLLNFALAHSLGIPPTLLYLNFPSWSVSIEFWLSLAFFLLLNVRPKAYWVWIGFAAVPIILAFPGFQLLAVEPTRVFVSGGLVRGIAGFSVGVAAYIYCNFFPTERIPRWAAPAALILLTLVFLKPTLEPGDSWFLYAAMFSVLVTLKTWDQDSFLSRRAFVFLGSISYSVYLLHIPLVRWLEFLFSEQQLQGDRKLFVLALLVPLAAAVFHYVEKPSQQAILSLWKKRKSAEGAARSAVAGGV